MTRPVTSRWLWHRLCSALAMFTGLMFTAALAALAAPDQPPDPPQLPAPDKPPSVNVTPAESLSSVPQPIPDSRLPPNAPASDLRDVLGIEGARSRAGVLRPTDVPSLPEMVLRGILRRRGQSTVALLEVTQLGRVFTVRAGSQIPLMVTGLSPRPTAEVNPLADQTPGRPNSLAPRAVLPPTATSPTSAQSQIIVKVLEVSAEGVKVEVGLLAQTLVIR